MSAPHLNASTLSVLCPLIQHIDPLGFDSAVLTATEGPLKISPLFPNGLTLFKEGREMARAKRERGETVRYGERETGMAF